MSTQQTVRFLLSLCLLALSQSSCTQLTDVKMQNPPIAKQLVHEQSHHGVVLSDPFHWLKDASYPDVDDAEVLAYLNAENEHFEQFMKPLEESKQTFIAELKSREVLNDWSVPFAYGGYFYQSRWLPHEDYPVYVRWLGPDESPVESEVQVVLDQRELAKGHDYFEIGGESLSNNHQLLAYSVDTQGDERYTMVVKDLTTSQLLDDRLENTTNGVVWLPSDTGFFYTRLDENWRPNEVRLHMLGTNPATDKQVYFEDDAGYFVSIAYTESRRYLLVEISSSITNEVRYLDLQSPEADLNLVSARRNEHEYSVDHRNTEFVIMSNKLHKNNTLFIAQGNDPSEENWVPLLEGNAERHITAYTPFENVLAVELRIKGQREVMLIDQDDEHFFIPFDEPTYTVHLGSNAGPSVRDLRIEYQSMVTPHTVLDFDVVTRTKTIKHVQEIPSGYDSSLYRSEYFTIRARDGVEVPVSLVYRVDTFKGEETPLYLTAYGSYGYAMPPSFSTRRLSLLDRGFIYAMAHVRGGDDLGDHWFEAGRLANRTNTFHDFVDVARGLIHRKYTSAGRIAISGGSAGGSIMGAVTNEAPDLWGVVVAHVPFVDILNTMLDDSLPLTPIEWPLWGNPIEDKAAFDNIRSYSPYDQLKKANYPPIMVTAGLQDPRVTYWEPAKYVAKLRTLKLDDNPLILRIEMGAGHGGKTGRANARDEISMEYAFILHALRDYLGN